jgi:hypothetical protein
VDAANSNLCLQDTSPAIDAGNNAAVPTEVTTDLDDNPRFVDIPTVPDTGHGAPPIVDMGAYEVQQQTGIDDQPLPRAVALQPNVPNPFNPATTIAFDLAQAGRVKLEVFDAAGRRIRVLLDEPRVAGTHRVRWDGTDHLGRPLASGVYFCRMDAGSFQGTIRMTLVR